MPGLIVLVQDGSENISRNRAVIRMMSSQIMHEPFYKVQFFEFKEFGLHAAKVYLDHEHSPETVSSDASRSISCIMSGELYAVEEITWELAQRGRSVLNPKNFSELALRLYELKGDAFLEDLNGCFTLLLVDKFKKTLLIANDRFGMTPLFFYRPPEGPTIFAPELKCFRMFPGLTLTLSAEALMQSFRFNCPLNNKTLYKEVERAAIASKFVYLGGVWSTGGYWTPEKVRVSPRLSQNDFIEASTTRFERIAAGYCEPGVTGLSLTGGWDTRAILSVLHSKGVNLPCYTFGGMYRDSFDVNLARVLAERTGNSHHTLILGKEFLRDFDRWVNKGIYVSDGASRVIQSHEYYVNLLAREHGNVRITGRFGSQIFSGISLLKDRTPDMGVLSPEFRSICIGTPASIPLKDLADVIRWELPQFYSWAQSQGAAALTVRTPFQDKELVNIMLRAPMLPDPRILQKTIVRRNTPEWADIPSNRGASINNGVTAALVKYGYKTFNFVDAAYNWERLPHLALRATRLGDRFGLGRFFNGRNEWVHYRLWFAGELREFIRQVLLDTETLGRACWNAKFIERMMKCHEEGTRNYTWEIDRVMGFELWFRQNRISA